MRMLRNRERRGGKDDIDTVHRQIRALSFSRWTKGSEGQASNKVDKARTFIHSTVDTSSYLSSLLALPFLPFLPPFTISDECRHEMRYLRVQLFSEPLTSPFSLLELLMSGPTRRPAGHAGHMV